MNDDDHDLLDTSTGYVTLERDDGSTETVRVALLVAQAFLPNPSGYRHVINLDGDITNNRATNLKWASDYEYEMWRQCNPGRMN